MPGMPMPGEWVMSMMWMRMPGQTWPGAAASFLGLWLVMMTAMMLPALVPMLHHYRRGLGRLADARIGRLTTIAGLGYITIWTVTGIVVYPIGVLIGTLAMTHPAFSRTIPQAAAMAIVVAGLLQLTPWKLRRLECCRETSLRGALRADMPAAWRHGLRLGVECSVCCANLMMILLAGGMMKPAVMFAVTAAIAVERLLPPDPRITRATGIPAIAAGIWLMIHVLSLTT